MSVTLHTNLGDIKCEIFCDEVPKTSESWLYQYDPMISFRDHSIRLYYDNQELELRGLFNTQPITTVYAMQVKRLVHKRDCTTALVMLREAEDDTEVQFEASTTDAEYLQKPFFHQFLDLFPDELPTTLSPRRPVDHTIDLISGQPPSNAIAGALSRMSKATKFAISGVQMEIPACFKNEYLTDKDFGDAFRALKSRNPTSVEMNMFASYTVMDELLYYLDRICVPHNGALRKILIQEHHEICLASSEEYLPLVEFAYNNAPHSVTAQSGISRSIGSDKLVHVQQKYQKQANKHRQHAKFNEGDLVLFYVASHRYKIVKSNFSKLRPRFYGSFKLIKKNSVVSYKLELPPSWGKLHPTFHISLLKHYIQGDSPVPKLSSYVPEIEDEHVILVPEMILHVRQKETRRKLTTEFLVKWMDLDESDSTWQTDEEMQQYLNLLQEFFDKRQIFL
ncbi:hypothetical protein L7F22_032952 [Adiantum nelumboides]|nr:hypothetical protein [Adiantum nelumboides]